MRVSESNGSVRTGQVWRESGSRPNFIVEQPLGDLEAGIRRW